MTLRRSTIISRDTPTASWSKVRRRFTDSHKQRAISAIVTKGRTRVSRSKAFTPRWTVARSLDRTRVIWPKLLGRETPKALDSLFTACWGTSALVMVGRVTGLPVETATTVVGSDVAERCLAALRARLTHDHRIDSGRVRRGGACALVLLARLPVTLRVRPMERLPVQDAVQQALVRVLVTYARLRRSGAAALWVGRALHSGSHPASWWSCSALMAV